MTSASLGSQLKPSTPAQLTLESWSQGFMIGAVLIMGGITIANMRKGVLLHKLIILELLLITPNGFFTFFDPPVWGWYLSSTAILLISSWTLHNVIAWMKNRPFLGQRGNLVYISTVILVQPYWIFELYANFAYFNGFNDRLFVSSRPLEAVCRDPWWIFTTANLLWNIRYRYEFGIRELIKVSPRFGLLLASMLISIIFIIFDLLSVTPALAIGVINPFWKFSTIFKCFTDTIILDDFKTALDKLSQHNMNRILPLAHNFNGLDGPDIHISGKILCRKSLRPSSCIASVEQFEDANTSCQPTRDAQVCPPPRVRSRDL